MSSVVRESIMPLCNVCGPLLTGSWGGFLVQQHHISPQTDAPDLFDGVFTISLWGQAIILGV